jgi:hypothetical protein
MLLFPIIHRLLRDVLLAKLHTRHIVRAIYDKE